MNIFQRLCPHRRLIAYVIASVIATTLGCAAWLAFNSTPHVPHATFTLLSGQKISTEQLTGKVYLVNFWATNCPSCIQEMPTLVSAYTEFKDQGLEVIAVAMSYDTPSYVKNYSQTRQLPFKVAIDDGSAAKKFGNIQLTPTTFVIDKDGRILKRYIGTPNPHELHQLLKSALASARANTFV
ncbi:TlpA family protein disulfide reductase [Mycoavidus sp. HKI]|uniref:TlpA disulfide reductase family protein n=1 Tax=Mycoavidus sp. HKI TaxID=2840467 RepID=UPI001CBA7FF9|nr:TlpA disulfide reductase family protein [Mycoavidus sp. HKI]UAW64071.1 TlpA family protein disulfide reductase [Mycoavidus sp. HKI]